MKKRVFFGVLLFILVPLLCGLSVWFVPEPFDFVVLLLFPIIVTINSLFCSILIIGE